MASPEQVEPNECPHCNGIDTTVRRHVTKAWFVKCNHCMAGGPPGETESQAVENWNHPSCATLGRLFVGLWNQYHFDDDLDDIEISPDWFNQIAQLGLDGWKFSRAGEGFVEMERDNEITKLSLVDNEMTLTHYTRSEEPD